MKTQPSPRKRKLLVFDVEGTLFETKVRLPSTTLNSTIWQSLAHELGNRAVKEEIETHLNWHSGMYASYLDWMKATISIHVKHGLTKSQFDRVIATARYNDGVPETFTGFDRNRFEFVLISGGFRELSLRAQRDLHIHHAFAACEYIFNDQGVLAAYNLLPCDFEGKIDFVRLMLREYRLGQRDWAFVGDGANDVPIAKQAPVSVAYRASDELRAVASYCIDDFRELAELFSREGW